MAMEMQKQDTWPRLGEAIEIKDLSLGLRIINLTQILEYFSRMINKKYHISFRH